MKHFLKQEGKFSLHEKSGYRFHRPSFLIWSVLLIVYVLGVFQWYLANGVLYVNCPADNNRPCENSLYGECDALRKTYNTDQYVYLCEQEFLNPGFTVGHKPPFFISSFGVIAAFSFIALLGYNHFVYNKDLKGEDLL